MSPLDELESLPDADAAPVASVTASMYTYAVTAPDEVPRAFLRPLAGVSGDVNELPREQLEIDGEAISAEIANGMRAAPGLRIFKA